MDARYAYGFFDGEGTIVMHSAALEVHVTQARMDVLEAFKARYGGRISVHRIGAIAPERVNGVQRQIWRWRLIGYDAAQFLRDALPYLVVKREKAEAALLEWDARLAQRQRKRMPNSYYEEQRLAGRETATCRMSAADLRAERLRRTEWLAIRGWD